MEEDNNYNLSNLSTTEYLDYIRLKLVTLDQHIMALWKNTLIQEGLSRKNKLKFAAFFDETAYIVDETLFLDDKREITDEEALKNLVIDFLDLMARAREIVNDARIILDQT